MTLPDHPPARKPPRLGLYAPFAVALVAAAIWCAAWFWLSAEVRRNMDAQRDTLNRQGWRVAWEARRISGFPFRLDVDVDDLRVREPSGWALAVSRVKGEAWAYAPGHWVLLAPAGVTITRRRGGRMGVSAKVLRASISDFGDAPARVSVEGEGLSFRVAPGAEPFSLNAAKELHLHTRAGPGDQGAVWFELDGAQARFSGLMGRIAAGKPVNLAVDAIYSHASALAGPDWPSAARAWRDAGGAVTVRHLRIGAGEADLDAHGGALGIGGDGRLRGSLTATLSQAPRALGAFRDAGAISAEASTSAATVLAARTRGSIATVTLDFQAGQTTLGPAAIGPSPRIF